MQRVGQIAPPLPGACGSRSGAGILGLTLILYRLSAVFLLVTLTPILLLRLLLAPALVGLASLAGRRYGPRMAGMAAALPIVAGPILLVLALQQGLAFAQAASADTLLGLLPLTAFCLAYAGLARLSDLRSLARWQAVAICLGLGWLLFLCIARLLLPVALPVWGCGLLGLAALLLGQALLPGRLDAPMNEKSLPKQAWWLELGLRMALAGAMVLGLTGLAQALGPAWSGLLAPFPVASSVVVAGCHFNQGPEALGQVLKGFLQAMLGFVAFLIILAFGLQGLGLAWAFGLGLAASLLVQAPLMLWRQARG